MSLTVIAASYIVSGLYGIHIVSTIQHYHKLYSMIIIGRRYKRLANKLANKITLLTESLF